MDNSHSDWRRTANIYAVKDIRQSPARDDEWFTRHIIIKDKTITVLVNGAVPNEWTEPEGFNLQGSPGRKVSSGTFALQGHDPDSEVHYRNIMVKVLP